MRAARRLRDGSALQRRLWGVLIILSLGTAVLAGARAAEPDATAPDDPRERARGTILREDVAEEALRKARASNPALPPLATRRSAARRATNAASESASEAQTPPKTYSNGLTDSHAH